METARKPAALAAALIALTLAAYAPAMSAGYMWDDSVYLTDNPEVTRAGLFGRIWWRTQADQYYPLTATSFWLEYRFWRGFESLAGRLPAGLADRVGLNRLGPDKPAGYHVTNILLHALGAALVWRLLRQLGLPGAWPAAALFALHPVNAATVAWITERKNTLSLVFSMLAALAYLRYLGLRIADCGLPKKVVQSAIRNPKSEMAVLPAFPRPRVPASAWYALSLLASALAMLSKTAVAALPMALLICVWWRRGRATRSDLPRVMPFFLISVALGLITVLHERVGTRNDPALIEGLSARLAGAAWAVWFYLYKLLLPAGLTVVYPRWRLEPPGLPTLIPPAVLVLAAAGLWHFRRTWARPLLAALGAYVALLLPALGIVRISYMRFSFVADHWQYVPMVGVAALAAAAGHRWVRRWPAVRRIGMALAAGIAVLFFVLTCRRAAVHADTIRLWTEAIDRNAACWVAYKGRGDAWQSRGRQLQDAGRIGPAVACFNRAIEDFSQVIALKPDDAEAWNNRGGAYQLKGEFGPALDDFFRALDLKPYYAEPHHNIANIHLDRGLYPQALAECDAAIAIRPDYPLSYNSRGNVYERLRRYDLAVRDYTRAIELRPTYAKAYNNRAVSYFHLHDYDQAWADVRQARRFGFQPDPRFIKLLADASGRQE